MNSEVMAVANSGLVFLLALIPIVLVVIQAFIFLGSAWKEGRKIGIKQGTLRKVVVNSVLFSIIPSLPIILIMAVLMPALGKYIPWLRLTVLGSAPYENMAADLAVKSFGLFGIADPGMTPSIFISVVWVMTLGVVSYPFVNGFFLKKYDGKLEKVKSGGGFAEVAMGTLFLGVMAAYMPPMLIDYQNVPGLAAVAGSGVLVILLDKIAKKTGIRSLGEFSFPLAMLFGMVVSVIVANIM